MAEHDVHTIIGKALTDAKFRTELGTNFEAAVGGHNLDAKEKQALKAVNWQEAIGGAGGPARAAGGWVHIYSTRAGAQGGVNE